MAMQAATADCSLRIAMRDTQPLRGLFASSGKRKPRRFMTKLDPVLSGSARDASPLASLCGGFRHNASNDEYKIAQTHASAKVVSSMPGIHELDELSETENTVSSLGTKHAALRMVLANAEIETALNESDEQAALDSEEHRSPAQKIWDSSLQDSSILSPRSWLGGDFGGSRPVSKGTPKSALGSTRPGTGATTWSSVTPSATSTSIHPHQLQSNLSSISLYSTAGSSLGSASRCLSPDGRFETWYDREQMREYEEELARHRQEHSHEIGQQHRQKAQKWRERQKLKDQDVRKQRLAANAAAAAERQEKERAALERQRKSVRDPKSPRWGERLSLKPIVAGDNQKSSADGGTAALRESGAGDIASAAPGVSSFTFLKSGTNARRKSQKQGADTKKQDNLQNALNRTLGSAVSRDRLGAVEIVEGNASTVITPKDRTLEKKRMTIDPTESKSLLKGLMDAGDITVIDQRGTTDQSLGMRALTKFRPQQDLSTRFGRVESLGTARKEMDRFKKLVSVRQKDFELLEPGEQENLRLAFWNHGSAAAADDKVGDSRRKPGKGRQTESRPSLLVDPAAGEPSHTGRRSSHIQGTSQVLNQLQGSVQAEGHEADGKKECDKAGIELTRALGPKGLRDCLLEYGIRGRTSEQQMELHRVCVEGSVTGTVNFYSFCFDIVPQARRVMRETRRQWLNDIFVELDSDGDFALHESECAAILQGRIGLPLDAKGSEQLRIDYKEVLSEQSDSETGLVHFEEFQELVAEMQERYERHRRQREWQIAEKMNLAGYTFRRHRQELVALHDSFQQFDTDNSGDLDRMEILDVLLEFGVVPRGKAEQERVEKVIKDCDHNGNGVIDFTEFLGMVQEIREECKRGREEHLRGAFAIHDRHKNGILTTGEVVGLLNELGLIPKTREEQDEIKQLLQDVDLDHSGELNFDDFQTLYQHASERLRGVHRRREETMAAGLGFDMRRLCEFREAFYTLDQDGSEELSITCLRRAMMLLGKNLSTHDLLSLFQTVDEDGSGAIDFGEFLILMKMIEERTGVFAVQTRVRSLDSLEEAQVRCLVDLLPISKEHVCMMDREQSLAVISENLGVEPRESLPDALGVVTFEQLVRRTREAVQMVRSMAAGDNAARAQTDTTRLLRKKTMELSGRTTSKDDFESNSHRGSLR